MRNIKRKATLAITMLFTLMTILVSNLSHKVAAAPPYTITMWRMRISDAAMVYNSNAPGLPAVFANHEEHINLYYSWHTPGKTGIYNSHPYAIYCIEPSNEHIWDSGNYEFDHEPINISLSAKQRGLLAYVLTYGQQYYYGTEKVSTGEAIETFSFASHSSATQAELKLQIATQLAAWVIGANIYEKNDPARHAMIGYDGYASPMFAPTEEIAKMARDLLDAAIDAWESTPFDLDGKEFQMVYNETTDLYELALTSHVFNTTSITTPDDWGYEIIAELVVAGLTVTYDPVDIDTTNTILLTHPNTPISSAVIDVEILDALKTPVYFITYDRGSAGSGYGQQMILIDQDMVNSNSSIKFNMNNRLLPAIGTTAKDKADGDKTVAPHEKVTIVDTVAYRNLDITKTYTLEGTLYQKSTGLPLLDANSNPVTATVTFTPQNPNGTVDVEFTFDARLLAGEQLVVFETLKESGVTVTTHNDITDLGQTVEVSWIFQTVATDKADNNKVMEPHEKVTLVDTVEYRNLDITKEYTLVGTVYEKSTGQPLVINGVTVTATKKFTPTTPDGKESVEFEFDARSLDGKIIVVFEKLYLNGVEIASHEDINDHGQSISIKKTPPTGDTTTVYGAISTLCIGSALVILMSKKRKDDDE